MLSLYKNIKEKRYEKGWSQSQLAELTGYSSKSMIARIEAGDVDLSQTKIVKFAEVFGCTPGELMGLDGTVEEKDSDIEKILYFANRLNRDGIKKLLEYAADLTEMKRYLEE